MNSCLHRQDPKNRQEHQDEKEYMDIRHSFDDLWRPVPIVVPRPEEERDEKEQSQEERGEREDRFHELVKGKVITPIDEEILRIVDRGQGRPRTR